MLFTNDDGTAMVEIETRRTPAKSIHIVKERYEKGTRYIVEKLDPMWEVRRKVYRAGKLAIDEVIAWEQTEQAAEALVRHLLNVE